MKYNIYMVPYEYDNLKRCFKGNNYQEAVKHYELMQLHYENADNIYNLDPNTPFSIEESGVYKDYPSVNQMMSEAHNMIKTLRKSQKGKCSAQNSKYTSCQN